ncbi:MAG: hypothetical protein ACTHMZ_14055 [Actinomycetes bacterium]
MSTKASLLLILAGFLLGGVISFWRQGKRVAAGILLVAAVLSFVAFLLYR